MRQASVSILEGMAGSRDRLGSESASVRLTPTRRSYGRRRFVDHIWPATRIAIAIETEKTPLRIFPSVCQIKQI